MSGPSAGGLVSGPTAGAISNNPAAYIPEDGLAITQVNELRSQLLQRHPLLSSAALLPQSLVASLASDLAAKQPLVQNKSLTIAQTSGLQAALDERAKTTDVTTAINTRQPLVQNNSLTIAHTSGLQAALDERAKTTDVTTAINTRQPLVQNNSLTEGDGRTPFPERGRQRPRSAGKKIIGGKCLTRLRAVVILD